MPETHEQQTRRILDAIGVDSRLKGAPIYHWYAIGEYKRQIYRQLDKLAITFRDRKENGEKLSDKEAELEKLVLDMMYNPEISAYTIDMINEDSRNESRTPLRIRYGYEKSDFVLYDPEYTTKQITDHFFPIDWPEFTNDGDWELMRDVIPAMQVARIGLKLYEDQRWLYDERSQRAAETLSYRIETVYPDKVLPERMPTDEEEKRLFAEYELKLKKGGNPRKWLQSIVGKRSNRVKNQK